MKAVQRLRPSPGLFWSAIVESTSVPTRRGVHAEGMAGWMTRTALADSTEPWTLITPETFLDDAKDTFLKLVAWWSES
jgi:hypothetical protein